MEFIVFRNPKLLARTEKFGGLVKLQNNLLILGKREYKLLEKIKKYAEYSSLSNDEKKTANKLIEFKILLKIDKANAEKIIKKIPAPVVALKGSL